MLLLLSALSLAQLSPVSVCSLSCLHAVSPAVAAADGIVALLFVVRLAVTAAVPSLRQSLLLLLSDVIAG